MARMEMTDFMMMFCFLIRLNDSSSRKSVHPVRASCGEGGVYAAQRVPCQRFISNRAGAPSRRSFPGSALPAPWLAVALAKVAERQSEWAPSLARRSPGGGGACWFRRPRRNRLPGKFAIARARSLRAGPAIEPESGALPRSSNARSLRVSSFFPRSPFGFRHSCASTIMSTSRNRSSTRTHLRIMMRQFVS